MARHVSDNVSYSGGEFFPAVFLIPSKTQAEIELYRERFAEYRIDIKRNFVNENVRSKLNRFLEEELETSYRKFSRERIILKREGRT